MPPGRGVVDCVQQPREVNLEKLSIFVHLGEPGMRMLLHSAVRRAVSWKRLMSETKGSQGRWVAIPLQRESPGGTGGPTRPPPRGTSYPSFCPYDAKGHVRPP